MQHRRILVVESDALFANQIQQALETIGQKGMSNSTEGLVSFISVDIVSDGNQVLYEAKVNPPDMIILSVELPKMSGYSICNKLKKNPASKGIPLIVMSSEATPEIFEQHKRLKTRAEDYLIKPFPMQTLISKVHRLLNIYREESSPGIQSDDGLKRRTTTMVGEQDLGTSEVPISIEEPEDEGHELEFDPNDRNQQKRFLFGTASEHGNDEPTRVSLDDEIAIATDLAFAALELPDVPEPYMSESHVAESRMNPSSSTLAPNPSFESKPMPNSNADAIALDDVVDSEVENDFSFNLVSQDLLEATPVISNDIALDDASDEDTDANRSDGTEGRDGFAGLDAFDVSSVSDLSTPELVNLSVMEPLPLYQESPGGGISASEMEKIEEESLPQLENDSVDVDKAERDAMQLRIQLLEQENSRLKSEVESVQSKATATGVAYSRDRELLNLREIINRKEKEILDLKDDVDVKERQILDNKDRVRQLERQVRDMDEKMLNVEREIMSANERIQALQQDKEMLHDREKSIKLRLEEAKQEIDKAYAEIENRKSKHQEAIQKLHDENETFRRDSEERLVALSDQHRGEIQRLTKEHGGEIERRDHQHREDMERREAEWMALKEKQHAEHEQLVATLAGKHQEELRAIEAQHSDSLRILREEHEAASIQQKNELALAIEREKRAADDKIVFLRQEHEEAIQSVHSNHQAATNALLEKHAAELKGLETRYERELLEKDEDLKQVLQSLREEQQEELQRLKKDHEYMVEELGKQHQKDMEAAKLEHEEKTQTLSRSHEDRISGMEARHQLMVDELTERSRREREEYDAALADSRSERERLETELTSVTDNYQDSLTKIQSLVSDIENARTQLAERGGNIETLEMQIAEYQDQMLKALQTLKIDEEYAEKALRAMAIAIALIEEQRKNHTGLTPTLSESIDS